VGNTVRTLLLAAPRSGFYWYGWNQWFSKPALTYCFTNRLSSNEPIKHTNLFL
jgi:hypothetical protein